MNQTTHYALNQWAGGDRLLCADFNSDNSKIDAALKTVSDAANAEKPGLVKIREIITQSGSKNIDVDVSDIMWDSYFQVDVHMEPPLGYIGHVQAFLNNRTENNLYKYCTAQAESGYSLQFADFMLFGDSQSPGSTQITFFCGSKYISSENSSAYLRPFRTAILILPGSNLNYDTLRWLNYKAVDVSIPAGCKISIYGVKR